VARDYRVLRSLRLRNHFSLSESGKTGRSEGEGKAEDNLARLVGSQLAYPVQFRVWLECPRDIFSLLLFVLQLSFFARFLIYAHVSVVTLSLLTTIYCLPPKLTSSECPGSPVEVRLVGVVTVEF
jgi:hypothetical protein